MTKQLIEKNNEVDYSKLRNIIRESRVKTESEILDYLQSIENTSLQDRLRFQKITIALIDELRLISKPDLLSLFISEYNLTSEEGLSLMTLVEAFLRVPDNKTRDQLFIDKVAMKSWSKHLGGSKSSMVNLATIALSIADKMIAHGHDAIIKNRIKQALEILSRPTVRFSANNVMKFFAKQFVFAESINAALNSNHSNKNLHSFDMLGEAAWTLEDANKYFLSYRNALIEIGKCNQTNGIFEADGISIKLSALHPKYDFIHRDRVISELIPKVLDLVGIAQKYNIGINIDAEEAERLDISLDIIDNVMKVIAGSDWQGFGVVVQAYQKRAPFVIDWLYHNCQKHNLKIMLRLVKGAYWDSEIKKAQVLGDIDYPVFTKKSNTDYSFLVCAQRLLKMRDFIYPQFASHNAHSLVSICEIAGNNIGFEIQRLHGMGESLHRVISSKYGILSRIYAPVGSHKELLAYLMRRLLENGANSSFINQLFDKNIKPSSLAADVLSKVEQDLDHSHSKIPLPKDIYKSVRQNSSSIVLTEQNEVDLLYKYQKPWLKNKWQAKSLIDSIKTSNGHKEKVLNPSDTIDIVGSVEDSSQSQLEDCLEAAKNSFSNYGHSHEKICKCLEQAANLYEINQAELMCLAMREAGKTYQDAIDEVREAVDFLRYYANLSRKVMPNNRKALGIFVCISPWNFPLAIFTGQIAAALSAGNVVIAKPAESTSLIAYRASQLLLEAGIPLGVFQLCLGKGFEVGAYLTSNSLVSGVAFTGSTQVAKKIKSNLIKNNNAKARIIAETGGLNAMVVDSTSLSEQVTRDVIEGAFKSAGQRCSALRILLIQDECFDQIITMIKGAMMELKSGNPLFLSTDCGPVINADAKLKLQSYIDKSKKENQVIEGLSSEITNGYFVTPTIICLNNIDEINDEFFGPILHVIRYKSQNLTNVIDRLNSKGYGLTFGIHSRIKKQVDEVIDIVNAGNIYVNRNQIGAIVGSQPFGGEGFSGTGPKAGGLNSLHGYSQNIKTGEIGSQELRLSSENEIQRLVAPKIIFNKSFIEKIQKKFPFIESEFFNLLNDTFSNYSVKHNLPGPTGESNELNYKPKGTALCLGPDSSDALKQTIMALALGNKTISQISDADYSSILNLGFSKENIQRLISGPSLNLLASSQYQVILYFGSLISVENILESCQEGIIPIMSSLYEPWKLIKEQVITVDTTASGGNANLLAL